MCYKTFTIFFIMVLLFSCDLVADPVSMPKMVNVKATVREAPPAWAVMQRHLMKTIDEAVPMYLDLYTYHGGTLNTNINIGLDNLLEGFKEWPLFYAIGGSEEILDLSLEEWNAITRQCTYQIDDYIYKEFRKHADMLHLSEGYVGFQYFGLADPTIPENIDRSCRFAGFYMDEDPEADNYDPEYKILRSISTGSEGAADHVDAGFTLDFEHASLYPILKDLEWDWRKNPERRKEIQKLYDEIVVPCDVPSNLAITGLVTHAYILTGEEKYKDWVLEYVGAWMDRIKENNGIIPDNIGRTGKIGEYRNGQWWGGYFGWSTRYSIEIMSKAIVTASECAYLVSGDPHYLDLLRSHVDMLLSKSKVKNGNLLIPYKYNSDGWYDYRPMEPYILSHLWHASMTQEDWGKIERIRKGKKNGPWAYASATSSSRPEPGSEVWRSDGTLYDWNKVLNDLYNNTHRRNEAPHLSYLGGTNPDWPEKILDAEYEQVCDKIDRYMNNPDNNDWGAHTFLAMSPVFTNGLAQMTMGAPYTSFNGGLLRARVRYFNIDRMRPGLPEDVSALVEKLEANRTVVQLVNTSAFETRKVIIQAGSYGEHSFTEVKFKEESKDSKGKEILVEKSIRVNNKFFTVELPPATSITLDIGTRRFVNKPTYAFPWHGDSVPMK